VLTKRGKMNEYTSELKDLKEIYKNTSDQLQELSDLKLRSLVYNMEQFLKTYKEANKYKMKSEVLDAKLECEECFGNDEEDEEDDDE
jgi:hypothetical protein